MLPLYLRKVWTGLRVKTTPLLFFFLSVAKSSKILLISVLLITSSDVTFFLNSSYGLRFSLLTADLLVSDKITRAFERAGTIQIVDLDIFKAFYRVWHAGLFHKITSCGISCKLYNFMLSFLSIDDFE